MTSIPADWRRIVMSYEVEDRPDVMTQDTMLVYVTETSDGLKNVSVTDPSEEAEEALLALNKMMADVSGHSWSSCELTIDASGKYNFNFSYDPPKRINGIYDEQSYARYNSYLEGVMHSA